MFDDPRRRCHVLPRTLSASGHELSPEPFGFEPDTDIAPHLTKGERGSSRARRRKCQVIVRALPIIWRLVSDRHRKCKSSRSGTSLVAALRAAHFMASAASASVPKSADRHARRDAVSQSGNQECRKADFLLLRLRINRR